MDLIQVINSPKKSHQLDSLLRCRNTHRYFSGAGWTPDLRAAKTFPSQVDALRECLRHSLVDVELIVRARDTGAELFRGQLY